MNELKVGDKVKLTIKDGYDPKAGWGNVNNGDIGSIVEIDQHKGKIYIDFKEQSRWSGWKDEVTLVNECSEESEKQEPSNDIQLFYKILDTKNSWYSSEIKAVMLEIILGLRKEV